MLIKLSDTQWVDSRFVRRLFVQQFNDNENLIYKLAADLGDKTVYGVAYKDFHEATKILEWLAQTISEASRHAE